MSETRFDAEKDQWEVVVNLLIDPDAIERLKEVHGMDASKEYISIACEQALIEFGKEVAKTGIDKLAIFQAITERGVGKIPAALALGIEVAQVL